MELYRWQRECMNAWQDNGCRGILNVATGAGKTRFALAAIQALRQRHPSLEVRVVVPTIALARQWLTALTHGAPSEAWRPGLFGGGRRDDGNRRVTVYVVNSAREALPAHMRRAFALGHPVLLICDECHHYRSPQNRRVFDFVTPRVLSGSLYASLGLSATPFDGEGDGTLKRALGDEIYRYGIDEAVTDGVLSAFTVCEVSAPFNDEEARAYQALTDKLVRLLNQLLESFPFLKPMGSAARLRAIRRLARDAGMAPEDVMTLMLDNTDGLTVLTQGGGDMLFARKGETIRRMKPFDVAVRSTLGAGDTFKAGCVYALLHGMDDDELVRFASACAAVAISRFPLPLHPPKLEEVRALISDRQWH
jgi:superfamily II DNA or RNA helicase